MHMYFHVAIILYITVRRQAAVQSAIHNSAVHALTHAHADLTHETSCLVVSLGVNEASDLAVEPAQLTQSVDQISH